MQITNESEAEMGNPRGKITGKRLGARGVLAQAMLSAGASFGEVRKETGISRTTARELSRRNLMNPARVKEVREHLRDRFALVAHDALSAVDQIKLKAAGVGELVRAAAVASDRAGLSAPSLIEQHVAVLVKYQMPEVPSALPAESEVKSILPGAPA